MSQYALVIGIAQYDHFRGLPKAATDAEAIARLLEKHHYIVTRLPRKLVAENQWAIDPSRKLTKADLGDELKTFLKDKADKQAAVIYFAGHGFRVKNELTDKEEGYLATSDSIQKTGPNAIKFNDLNTLISSSSLSSLVMLLDCCYAGSLIEEQRSLLEPTQITIHQQSNSCLIAACRDFERAREGKEHGIFTAAVLEGLSAKPAQNRKITSADLFGSVSRELEKSGQEVIHAGMGRAIPLIQYSKDQEIPSPLKAHYTQVIKAFRRGTVVPFLGSDVNSISRPKELKTWFFGCNYLPTNSELAKYLAERFAYFQEGKMQSLQEHWEALESDIREELQEMALQHWMEYVVLRVGIGELYGEMRQIFNFKDYPPNRLYRFFTEKLPGIMGEKFNKLLIVTTNLDGALEDAFRKAGKQFDLVYYGHQEGRFFHQPPGEEVKLIKKPNTYGGLLEQRPVILRLCGPKDWDNDQDFVVSEDCYIDYLVELKINQRLPIQLLKKLTKNNHIYFLGYSLSHWYQRLILQRIWKAPKPVSKIFNWWSIESNPRLLDQKIWNEWANVEVITRPLDDYIAGLEQQAGKEKQS